MQNLLALRLAIVTSTLGIAAYTAEAAPGVLSVSPAQNGQNVNIDTNIEIEFSDPMDLDTIHAFIHSETTGWHPASSALSASKQKLVLEPGIDFDIGEVVTVTLAEGMRTESGQLLAQGYTWSFTTEVFGGSHLFADPVHYATADVSHSLFLADLDADSHIDMMSGSTRTAAASDLLSVLLRNNPPPQPEFDHTSYGIGDFAYGVVAADLDNDGDMDIATANSESDDVSILYNIDAAGLFDDATATTVSLNQPGAGPRSIVAADLNNDGYLDLATANDGGNNISVILYNEASGQYVVNNSGHVGEEPTEIIAVDLNNDYYMDLAVVNWDYSSSANDTLAVLLNNHDATFDVDAILDFTNSPRALAAADFDGDGDADLAVLESGGGGSGGTDGRVHLKMNGGTGMTYYTVAGGPYDVQNTPSSIVAADFNGDGKTDIGVANTNFSASVSILLGTGDGTLGKAGHYGTIKVWPQSIKAGDFDRDGDLDVAVVASMKTGSEADAYATILFNEGTPFFAAGNFEFGKIYMSIGDESSWNFPFYNIWPTSKNTGEIYQKSDAPIPVRGYTDHKGNVTFRLPVHCKDKSGTYDGVFEVKATLDYPEHSNFWPPNWGPTTWRWESASARGLNEKKQSVKYFEAHVPEGQTQDFDVWVSAAVYSQALGLGANRLVGNEEWYTGTVTVESRAQSAYQQSVELTAPAAKSQYYFGDAMTISVQLRYKAIDGTPTDCPDTAVEVHVIPKDSQQANIVDGVPWEGEYFRLMTGPLGTASTTVTIPEGVSKAGKLLIIAQDESKWHPTEGFIAGRPHEIEVQADYKDSSPGKDNFTIFSNQVLGATPGQVATSLIGVVPINQYSGTVTFSLSSAPAYVLSESFDPPSVTISSGNESKGSVLYMGISPSAPLGSAEDITITATDGTGTSRELVYQLRVTPEREISANEYGGWEDIFPESSSVYGYGMLGLDPATTYDIHIVDAQVDWGSLDGSAISSLPQSWSTPPETTFTTDANGDMAAWTLLWADAEVVASAVPADFDIIVDVTNPGIFDLGGDILDANLVEGFPGFTVVSAPEPGRLLLLGWGVTCLTLLGRRRRR